HRPKQRRYRRPPQADGGSGRARRKEVGASEAPAAVTDPRTPKYPRSVARSVDDGPHDGPVTDPTDPRKKPTDPHGPQNLQGTLTDPRPYNKYGARSVTQRGSRGQSRPWRFR